MTNIELQEMLKKFPSDMKIYIPTRRSEDGYENITIVCKDENFEVFNRLRGYEIKSGLIII